MKIPNAPATFAPPGEEVGRLHSFRLVTFEECKRDDRLPQPNVGLLGDRKQPRFPAPDLATHPSATAIEYELATRTFRMGHSTQYLVTPERGSPPDDIHPERGSGSLTATRIHLMKRRCSNAAPFFI